MLNQSDRVKQGWRCLAALMSHYLAVPPRLINKQKHMSEALGPTPKNTGLSRTATHVSISKHVRAPFSTCLTHITTIHTYHISHVEIFVLEINTIDMMPKRLLKFGHVIRA